MQLGCSRAWIYYVLHRERAWRDQPRNHLATTRQLLGKLRDVIDEAVLSRLLGVSEKELRRIFVPDAKSKLFRIRGNVPVARTDTLPPARSSDHRGPRGNGRDASKAAAGMSADTPATTTSRHEYRSSDSIEFDAGLTVRQITVMQMVGQGLSNRQIAHRLRLSEGTVKNHLHAIYQKTGLANRTALALLVFRKAPR